MFTLGGKSQSCSHNHIAILIECFVTHRTKSLIVKWPSLEIFR